MKQEKMEGKRSTSIIIAAALSLPIWKERLVVVLIDPVDESKGLLCATADVHSMMIIISPPLLFSSFEFPLPLLAFLFAFPVSDVLVTKERRREGEKNGPAMQF